MKYLIMIFAITGVLCTACDENNEPKNMGGILVSHNKVRAENGVGSLQWSKDMTVYAQEWANYLANNNGCKMLHRANADMDKLKVGENLYWASPQNWSDGRVERQNIIPSDVVYSWASEKADYNYSSNKCRENVQCGHYTQVVWRSTTAVGCAMAFCPDQGQIWVCNYDPPGNWVGERPY